MPKPSAFILVFCALAGGSSCTSIYHEQAFYVSPVNGSSDGYHALPMHSDTTRTAAYVRVSGFDGTANDLQTDHFGGANASIYIAHHGKWWQGYYGLDGTFGSYSLGRWQGGFEHNNLFNPLLLSFNGYILDDREYAAPATANQLNSYHGAYTYGTLGFSGGFNGVIPMGQGEWRFIGIETALHHEFGQYLDLRRKMPDSIAGYISRNPFYGTLGLNSELIFRTTTGDFGFKFAGGWVLGAGYRPATVFDSAAWRPLRYGGYATFTAHYTMGRFTFYYQGEAATKANSYQLGFIYRFDRPRLPAKKRLYYERPPLPPRPRLPFGL